MNDWRSRNKMTGRDAMKAAAAVLGLMAGILLIIWVATRFLH